jgi:MFS family permease
MTLAHRYPALTYPNYRLYFAAQIVSILGMWMQQTALGYLVFDLTKSPAYLGYVSFAFGLPTWFLTLYGGIVADRLPRRNVLVVTQTWNMILALALSALTFMQVVEPWHIVVFALLSGVGGSFDGPARQAFVLELVDRRDMANAIVLNATMFNLGITLGPALGGLVYAAVGPGWCFFLNGLTMIIPTAALLIMRLNPNPPVVRSGSALTELGEGLRFAVSEPIVRTLILMIAATTFFARSLTTLFPAWAVNILGGDATTNGLLMSAVGLGAFVSSLSIASLGRFSFKGKLLTIGSFLTPLTLLVFAAVRWLPLSLATLAAYGLSWIPVVNLANALVQGQLPDRLRGRVMSIYTLGFMGSMTLGGLWCGAMAQWVGEPATFAVGAVAMLVISTAVAVFAPKIRALP